VGRDGWDSAADWNGDPMGGRRSEPTPVPSSRKNVEVVCCPHCQSVDVKKRDWRAGQAWAFWLCGGCGGSWKEPADVGGGGRKAALP
jgi:ribosomal protein L37AE/L43A